MNSDVIPVHPNPCAEAAEIMIADCATTESNENAAVLVIASISVDPGLPQR
jgi:hypothetical protein